MDGIRKAREREVHFGRKPKLTEEQVRELRQKRRDGELIKDLMKEYNLSNASIYRYLSQAVLVEDTVDV